MFFDNQEIRRKREKGRQGHNFFFNLIIFYFQNHALFYKKEVITRINFNVFPWDTFEKTPCIITCGLVASKMSSTCG